MVLYTPRVEKSSGIRSGLQILKGSPSVTGAFYESMLMRCRHIVHVLLLFAPGLRATRYKALVGPAKSTLRVPS